MVVARGPPRTVTIISSFYHKQPLSLVADLVVHGVTKALCGHKDLMSGAISGSKDRYDDPWFTSQAIGAVLDANSASLFERGLKSPKLLGHSTGRGGPLYNPSAADTMFVSPARCLLPCNFFAPYAHVCGCGPR